MKKIVMKAAAAAMLLVSLSGCSLFGGADASDGETGHAEAGSEEPAEGPHGGRLLRDGDFAVEMTIFEDGVEPQFRVYPTRGGEAVDPASVNLTVVLRRLGGEVNRFAFTAQRSYLLGRGVVTEPHSFDVEVIAVEGGRRHRWTYASPEGLHPHHRRGRARGRHRDCPCWSRDHWRRARELYGTVALATTARSEIRGQFPGRIVSVNSRGR